MIYTVTFNPSIDYIVRMPRLEPGAINRVTYEDILPGGKGINVSIVLSNLGHESRALGFVAGFTGAEIVRLMQTSGAKSDFIHVAEGMSRINMPPRRPRSTASVPRSSSPTSTRSMPGSTPCSGATPS